MMTMNLYIHEQTEIYIIYTCIISIFKFNLLTVLMKSPQPDPLVFP